MSKNTKGGSPPNNLDPLDDNSGGATTTSCEHCQKYKKAALEIKESKKILAVKTKKILEKLKETKQKLDSKDNSLSNQVELLTQKLKKVQDAGKKVVNEYESRISGLKEIIRLNDEKGLEECNLNKERYEKEIGVLNAEIARLGQLKEKESLKHIDEITEIKQNIIGLKDKNNEYIVAIEKYNKNMEEVKIDLKSKTEEIDKYRAIVLKMKIDNKKEEKVRNKKTNDVGEIDVEDANSNIDNDDNTEKNISIGAVKNEKGTKNDGDNTGLSRDGSQDSDNESKDNSDDINKTNNKDNNFPTSANSDVALQLESSLMKSKSLELAYNDLKSKHDELGKNVTRKQDMLKKVADRYKEMQKRYKDIRLELKNTKKLLSEQKNGKILDDEKINRIELELKEASSSVNNSNLKIEELKHANADLSNEIASMKVKHDERVTEIEEKMNQQWSARNKELVDKDDECLRLKKELADINANNDGWLNERDQLKGQYNALKLELEKLKEDYETYQNKARIALKAQTDSEFKKVSKLNDEIEKLRQNNLNLENKATITNSKMKELLQRLKVVKAKSKGYENKVAEKEKQRGDILDMLSDLEKSIKILNVSLFSYHKLLLLTFYTPLTNILVHTTYLCVQQNHSEQLNKLEEKLLKEIKRMEIMKRKLSIILRVGIIGKNNSNYNNNHHLTDTNSSITGGTKAVGEFGIDSSIAAKLVEDAFSSSDDNHYVDDGVTEDGDSNNLTFGMDESVAKNLIDNLFSSNSTEPSVADEKNHFISHSTPPSSRIIDMVVDPLEGLNNSNFHNDIKKYDNVDHESNGNVDNATSSQNTNNSEIAEIGKNVDAEGHQENLLLAAVQAAVDSTSSLDLLEKTDEKFIVARQDNENTVEALSLQERYNINVNELAKLKNEFTESVQMNALHLKQQNVLKEEIRELHRKIKRNETLLGEGNNDESGDSVGKHKNINLEYLKKCIYQFMIADEPNERLTLVDPICTILKMSPGEINCVKKVANYEANSGVLSGVVNFFSPYTPTKS
jgi:hypothetical protein